MNMNIVYSSSNEYAEILGTSIVSLFENNKDINEINLFIIDNGIKNDNREKLVTIARKYNRKIKFLDSLDIEKMANTKINVGNWHISTFYRLFLSSILPQSIDKVLYIDCDTIILNSLKNIWEVDMKNYWVMGVDDCRGSRYRSNIGLRDNSIYINNGFILIDLKAWRENNIEEKYLAFINKYNGDITYVDQGVLNGVLGSFGRIGLMKQEYNIQTVFLECSYDEIKIYRRPIFAYSKEEYDKAVNNPIVIHFTSFFMSGTRPWNKENNHVYRNEFLRYRSMTPWKESPLWDDSRNYGRILITKILNMLPKKIVFNIVSLAHAKLYPMVRDIKMNYRSNHI